jgi:F-box domain.
MDGFKHFMELPDEIAEEIVSHLDTRDLQRFSQTSKYSGSVSEWHLKNRYKRLLSAHPWIAFCQEQKEFAKFLENPVSLITGRKRDARKIKEALSADAAAFLFIILSSVELGSETMLMKKLGTPQYGFFTVVDLNFFKLEDLVVLLSNDNTILFDLIENEELETLFDREDVEFLRNNYDEDGITKFLTNKYGYDKARELLARELLKYVQFAGNYFGFFDPETESLPLLLKGFVTKGILENFTLETQVQILSWFGVKTQEQFFDYERGIVLELIGLFPFLPWDGTICIGGKIKLDEEYDIYLHLDALLTDVDIGKWSHKD